MDFKASSSTPQMLFEVLGPGKLCLMMMSWHNYLKKPLFYKHWCFNLLRPSDLLNMPMIYKCVIQPLFFEIISPFVWGTALKIRSLWTSYPFPVGNKRVAEKTLWPPGMTRFPSSQISYFLFDLNIHSTHFLSASSWHCLANNWLMLYQCLFIQ